MSLVETSGHVASRAYYKALIEGSKTTVTGLRKEYETLSKTLADAMSSGDIEKYDKQWYAMQNDIASVKNELVEAANATLEYANALRQIDWDMFDRGLDVISKLNDEAEFFIELLSYSDLFNKDSGDWTDAGITTRGLMVQEYQDYVDQANAYGNEAEEIRKLLQTDPKNTTLIDRYYELIEAQRQAILNAKKEKKAVEDLIKDGYDNLLERIKKLIDEYKKALNAAKDLHDYENTINEKNKAISDIQKQLLAYGNGNDTSEENRATLQKLNADLIAAQKDLQETEYDKYISDQESLLDDFYNELEEWLNGRLDELSSLFEEAVAATNLNGKLIDDTLHETANSVNYRMTDEFTGIWDKYADESGIAATSLNILDLTHGVTDSIRIKMDELPTEASLEEFFNGDDLRILQELTSVNNNTTNMIDAINSTNAALDQIRSNIVEYSGVLGNKIDYAGQAVANAVNSLEFSTGSSSYNAPSGGGSGGGSSSSSSTTKTQTQTAAKKFKVLDEYGNVYQSGIDTAVHASQIANAYKGHKLDQLSKAVSSGMPQSEYNRLKALYNKIKVVAYAKGGSIGKDTTILDSIARLLGEDHMVAAKEGERILTEEQNKNFEKMVNANFTPLDSTLKDKYSMLSGTNGVDIASMMANMPTPQVGDNANIGNTTTIGDINISLPNVTNKEEFINWLKNDGQIERILQAMTVGRLTGGNSYNKMKY